MSPNVPPTREPRGGRRGSTDRVDVRHEFRAGVRAPSSPRPARLPEVSAP